MSERMGSLPSGRGGSKPDGKGSQGLCRKRMGWHTIPTPPSLQGCTYSVPRLTPTSPSATSSLVPASHIGPPSGSEPAVLHHRLWLLHLHFSFCTAKYSFQMCLLTEVTFLVLLTCSFFLIYFATPPASYSLPPLIRTTFFLIFFPFWINSPTHTLSILSVIK